MQLFYGADEPGFMVTTSAQQLIRDPKLFVDSTFVQPAKQPAEQKKPEDKHKVKMRSFSQVTFSL